MLTAVGGANRSTTNAPDLDHKQHFTNNHIQKDINPLLHWQKVSGNLDLRAPLADFCILKPSPTGTLSGPVVTLFGRDFAEMGSSSLIHSLDI